MGIISVLLKKKVKVSMWFVVIVCLTAVGIITVRLLVTDFGKYSGIDMELPQSKKLDDLSYLECKSNIWGHVQTRNDILQKGASGWTKNTSDKNSEVAIIEVSDNVVKVSGTKTLGMDGDFQIISGGISSPRLLAQDVQSYQSYTKGNFLLIDAGIGQLIISRTQNFGNGLLNDSLIYTCESKANHYSSSSNLAIDILVKIEEIKKIQAIIEQSGNKIFFQPEGEENGKQRIEMGEQLGDHTSRITTFYVDNISKVVTIEDIVNNRRISLEEWKIQIRKDWNF